jgi:glycosyltransferase involved in cell wall biosynthesis
MTANASDTGASDPSAPGARASRQRAHRWVSPPFDGEPTGGTLYGAGLVAALARRGIDARRIDVDAAIAAIGRGEDAVYWIDSLYLDRLAELRNKNARGRRLVLVAHYLPTLVAHGDAWRAQHATPIERQAIACVDAVLTTSTTMARAILALAPDVPVAQVEPGVEVERAHPVLADPPRAVLIANVTEGKGILPFLRALLSSVRDTDRFGLCVAGSTSREPVYALACRDLVQAHCTSLAKVTFLGAVSHDAAMRELARADVLVSASRMESYGMVLAEARAAGLPILATTGGHAAAHVATEAGGELVSDAPSLAERFLALTRDPAELLRRKLAALAHRRARSWDDAARDFLRALAELDV